MSPLITAGNFFQNAALWLAVIAGTAANIALAVVLGLILLRFLFDYFNLSPFGKFAYYIRKPTNRWFYEIKESQFYYPLRRTFGFDPIWILLLLAFVLFFFLLRGLIGDVVVFLSCISKTLVAFGQGEIVTAVKYLIGTVLIGMIFFLMGMMTVLVIHSWFGLFDRAAFWAGQRIYPLLRSFDRSGQFGGLIFLIAFFVLGFVSQAVLVAFF
jgi:hypothetical protein